MRIGLVIYGSLATVSGGYLYDRRLVDYLQCAGDTVDILSRPWRNYARHVSDNVAREFYHQLRTAPVDVLVQDELNHPSLFLINQRLRREAKYPILSIVHHPRCYESHPTALKWFYRQIERSYLSSVNGFIFNSETTRRAVSQILDRSSLPRSIVAQPAGDRFKSTVTPEQLAARSTQADRLRIVFVGNLIPRKGLHVLIEALAWLSVNSYELTIVGNPDVDRRYTHSIRRRVNRYHMTNVRFAGELPDDELAAVLARSHVLAVPSDYEGFGIVYLEGMSFGLPAIATTSGAASEVIADGVNGFLVAPNQAVALAARLRELHLDRAWLMRLSVAAHERFLAQPTWDHSMAQVRDFISGWKA